MSTNQLRNWMWAEALAMLEEADRLHRQFFRVDPHAWEPPADVVEADGELRVHVALPGVRADAITLVVDRDGVVVSALRSFPGREEGGLIHRLEIPYGRFERRLTLPMEALELTGRHLADGVLNLTFRRKEKA